MRLVRSFWLLSPIGHHAEAHIDSFAAYAAIIGCGSVKRIPKSFPLGSYTIKVVYLDDDHMLKKSGGTPAYGLFDPNELTIYLATPPPRNKGARQIIWQTFWHEYTHALLWVSLPKYYTKEPLVDQIGHCLAQMQEAKY